MESLTVAAVKALVVALFRRSAGLSLRVAPVRASTTVLPVADAVAEA